MKKKIFKSTCLVAITVLLTCLLLIGGVLYQYFDGLSEEELADTAAYLSHAYENEGIEYFDGLKLEYKRITLVNSDGTVVFDSKADISVLDNHLSREEISEAFANGYGKSERYSDTLTEKTSYYAVLQSDGNVLRVASTQYSVLTLLIGLIQPIMVTAIIVLIIAAWLSSRVAKNVLAPINEIDLENPGDAAVYDELAPLFGKILQQKRIIDLQVKKARKKQEEFKLITENMNEGFLLIDRETNLLTYNKAALRLLGEAGVPDGGSVLKLNRTANFRKTVSRVLEGEKFECEMEYGGRVFELIASPVLEKERVIGAVIIIIDITEKSEREKFRREFTANVSHEMKTPLTSISGFAEMMKNGVVEKDEIKDFSNSIYDEAQRLISLVSDIIKISELEEKPPESSSNEWEQIDLYEVAERFVRREKIQAESMRVSLTIAGVHGIVYGVRSIIDEMVGNVIDNAVKYNKIGGEVQICISENDTDVSFSVKDTGIGIEPIHQDRVFERFYRVDKSRSKELGGTGLGLSIVKHGAVYHGADVYLDSTPGIGTEVTIVFKKSDR